MQKRNLILLVLFCVIFFVFMEGLRQFKKGCSCSFDEFSEINGVNYYQSDADWDMWNPEKFNEDLIDKELKLAKDYGFNLIYTYLPYAYFNENTPKIYIEQLNTFLTKCEKYNLKAILTLFDVPESLLSGLKLYDPTNWGSEKNFIKLLLVNHEFGNNQTIYGWDLRNEIDVSYDKKGNFILKAVANSWVKEMSSYIKQLQKEYSLSRQCIGVEVSHLNRAYWFNDTDIDFIGTSSYNWDTLMILLDIELLKENITKPIIITEYGKPTIPFPWTLRYAKEWVNLQRENIDMVDFGKVQWTLMDFPNALHASEVQRYYGLFDENGDQKYKTGEYYQWNNNWFDVKWQDFTGEWKELNGVLRQIDKKGLGIIENTEFQNIRSEILSTDVKIDEGKEAGLIFNVQDINNFLSIFIDSQNRKIGLKRIENGVGEIIQEVPANIQNKEWYNIRLENYYNPFTNWISIIIWLNDDKSFVYEYKDSSFLEGRIGIYTIDTNASFDNIKLFLP